MKIGANGVFAKWTGKSDGGWSRVFNRVASVIGLPRQEPPLARRPNQNTAFSTVFRKYRSAPTSLAVARASHRPVMSPLATRENRTRTSSRATGNPAYGERTSGIRSHRIWWRVPTVAFRLAKYRDVRTTECSVCKDRSIIKILTLRED